MNAVRIFTLCVGVMLLSGGFMTRVAAQDDPFPHEPLISRASDKAAWTVSYRYRPVDTAPRPEGESKQKLPDQIATVQVQKAGKIYHRITTWVSGAKAEAWTVNQRQLLKGKGENTYVVMPNEGPATDDYSSSDFEDLAWITMKNYTGFKKGDQPVFVFQAKNSDRTLTRREKYSLVLLKLPAASPAGTKAPTGSPGASPGKTDTQAALEQLFGDSTATVVLDATTQLPVAYDDGRTIWTYQFTATPPDALTPPPEVTNVLRRYEEYLKGTKIHPSTP